MKPGRYLQLRRTAAGLSIEDAAARISSEPTVDGQTRAAMLLAVEAGKQPVTDDVVAALRPVFPFDPEVLALCAAGAAPPICRDCGCSEWDACILPGGRTCSWSTPDLCSACVRAAQ